jgi:Fungal specific transcription factor domain/Fungal Zn(2)-Cys(6) binuclear cluster domain
MTPTPPSTHSSNSGQSPDAQFRVVRKRNRIPLSCGSCRHRKLKCDRSSPCQNCVKRADAASCAYATPSSKKRPGQTHSQTSSNSPDDMQNRIDRLEGLVLSLMTNGSQSAGPTAAAAALSAGASSTGSGPHLEGEIEETQMLDDGSEETPADDSDTEKVTKSFGIMKVDNENKKTFYIGEGHWAAVLHDIAEVRNYFQTHKNQFEEQMHRVAQTRKDMNDDSGPALLFGASKPPPRSEILSQLPSKYLTDILVARYFNTFDPATHILHSPVFQKQYNAHWPDPSKTSIVWIAMLFAMLRIALLSYARDGDEPPEFAGKSLDLSNTYRTAMANCLILADYTKPHQHIIETLIFHLHAEYRRNQDSEASVWVLVGMIVRLAMRMGYHRDSKMFPNITPFQGEMRRRVWTFVRQADLLFSFQISLPAMIRIGDSDTELPRNIYDEEFDEDTTMLPPSRPMSEPTTVSYMITKARLAFGFGRVLEEVNGVRSKPYEEILKVDKGLREIFEAVPDHLKLRPMNEQYHLPVTHIIARFHIAAVYHKSQCVLHRRFLRSARNNPRYAYSRRTCLESAMALMEFQSTMHCETRENGRLRNKKSWFTSLTAHDFLLAATIILMDLYLEKQRAEANAASAATSPRTTFSDSNSGGSGSVSEAYGFTMGMEHSQEDLLRALEESRDIWTGLRDESMEAYKASEILNVLLTQLKAPSGQPHCLNDEQRYRAGNNNGVHGQVDEKQNAAMTLGLLSSGGKSPNDGLSGQQQSNQRNSGTVFENTNSIEGFLQPSVPTSVPNGGVFDTQSAANGSIPLLGMFGASATDGGGGMNIDWVSG